MVAPVETVTVVWDWYRGIGYYLIVRDVGLKAGPCRGRGRPGLDWF